MPPNEPVAEVLLNSRGPDSDATIFATATPPGAGGIAVLRLSGDLARRIGEAVTGRALAPRHATFCRFRDRQGAVIDSGIALYFQAPASFTGEDVVELQGHGGPVVQQLLARRVAELGARPARPGEFSERAFLNDKLDLAQAEAIADLISAETEAAARAAQRSLGGAFSEQVQALQEQLTELRVFVEAALDFPDEDIDFIADSDVAERLEGVWASLGKLLEAAKRGRVLRDGVTVALLGQPNAGKSSLLNALAGRETAIVTDIPGTTRDVLREFLSLDGLPVHVADTAGIREASDAVEAEGVRRARVALSTADLVLLVIDLSQPLEPQLALGREAPAGIPVLRLFNKADLVTRPPPEAQQPGSLVLSVTQGRGLDRLVAELRSAAGLAEGMGESTGGTFSARSRHLEALRRTREHLEAGMSQLRELGAAEILAEELRLAQGRLGQITGEMLPDDLLGAIFASFCIGK